MNPPFLRIVGRWKVFGSPRLSRPYRRLSYDPDRLVMDVMGHEVGSPAITVIATLSDKCEKALLTPVRRAEEDRLAGWHTYTHCDKSISAPIIRDLYSHLTPKCERGTVEAVVVHGRLKEAISIEMRFDVKV